MPFLERESVDAAAVAGAPVVEFFYGAPDPALVVRARSRRRGLVSLAGRVAAKRRSAAEAAGCDFVIAPGRVEAGGHVRGRSRLAARCSREVRRCRCACPVARRRRRSPRGRELAAVLAAGAAGARLGTRMLAASEANVHPVYRERLFAARAEDTILTETFSAGWPRAPHRVLRSAVAAAESCRDDVTGALPVPGGLLQIPRLGPISPTRETTGRVEAMALYAGEGVGAVQRVEPAAAIVARDRRGRRGAARGPGARRATKVRRSALPASSCSERRLRESEEPGGLAQRKSSAVAGSHSAEATRQVPSSSRRRTSK